MKILYREHRGTLVDSMATTRIITSPKDIPCHSRESGLCKCTKKLEIDYYCYDERVKWDCFIVSCEKKVMGFIRGIKNKRKLLRWFNNA